MARKVKIDNATLKRLTREETKRPQDFRPQRRYFLIVCEGTKTEPNYFKGLKQNRPPGVIELIDLEVEGTGHNTLTVIDDALKAKQRFIKIGRTVDEVWTVFDRDSFPEENFNNAILGWGRSRRFGAIEILSRF